MEDGPEENEDDHSEEDGVEYPYEFSKEKRKKARAYSKQKLYIGLVQGTLIPIAVLLILQFSILSESLEVLSMDLLGAVGITNYWLGAVLFVIFFLLINFVVGLPISYYSGYKLEHRYGLSNQDVPGWVKDQLKSLALMLLMTTPLIVGVFYLGDTFPVWWWFYAGLIYFVILGILSNISHLIFLPLFYDLEELKDDELSQRLIDMAHENGVPEVNKVVKVNAKEKTEKANAGFAGLGKTKRIYLFDNLLDKFHDQEIEGVVAHEMGHYVNKDVVRFMFIEAITIFPVLYITGLIFTRWGSFGQIHNLPLFLLILYGFYSIIGPITLWYSRFREKRADRFALDVVEKKRPMVSAFKRLSDIDLAEIDPPRIVELLFYSHPPPKKRIEMTERFNE